MVTKFDSIEAVRNYISKFANISPSRELVLKEITFKTEMRRKIRHNLVAPKAFIFTVPDGKEHTIVVDNYCDGLACWLIDEKRFAKRL